MYLISIKKLIRTICFISFPIENMHTPRASVELFFRWGKWLTPPRFNYYELDQCALKMKYNLKNMLQSKVLYVPYGNGNSRYDLTSSCFNKIVRVVEFSVCLLNRGSSEGVWFICRSSKWEMTMESKLVKWTGMCLPMFQALIPKMAMVTLRVRCESFNSG